MLCRLFPRLSRGIPINRRIRMIFAGASFIALLGGVFTSGTSALQSKGQVSRENGCVRCHSALSAPAEMSKRFLDWRTSVHKAAGVSCDKCHGGNALVGDYASAHSGVFSPSNVKSSLNESNAPETCGRCHLAVANAFIESDHYRRLKSSGLGPSCINCHSHMGSSVTRAPIEGTSLCTFCHNSVNGLLPQRPEIVKRAKSTLDAISRTNSMVTWIDELLADARTRKLDVAAEENDFKLLMSSLANAKSAWHVFNLQSSATKADRSFEDALKIKDSLSKRLARD
jgi:hypothetical protein